MAVFSGRPRSEGASLLRSAGCHVNAAAFWRCDLQKRSAQTHVSCQQASDHTDLCCACARLFPTALEGKARTSLARTELNKKQSWTELDQERRRSSAAVQDVVHVPLGAFVVQRLIITRRQQREKSPFPLALTVRRRDDGLDLTW